MNAATHQQFALNASQLFGRVSLLLNAIKILAIVMLLSWQFVFDPTILPAQAGLGQVARRLEIPIPPSERQVGSIIVNGGANQKIGTAFVIAPNKIVTSFQLFQKSNSAKFILDSSATFDIDGFYGVSPGKDLLILHIKNTGVTLYPLPLNGNDPLQVGIDLVPQIGAKGKGLVPQLLVLDPRPLTYKVYWPKLHAQLRGDDYSQGRTTFDINSPIRDRNTEWLILDVALDSTAAGAPVWNPATKTVIGMLSAPMEKTNLTQSVVHIKHVQELLSRSAENFQPLSELSKSADDSELPQAPPDSRPFRDGFLAERLTKNLNRIALTEKAKVDTERLFTKLRDESIKSRTKADQANRQITAMRPTISATELTRSRIIDEQTRRGTNVLQVTQQPRFSPDQEQLMSQLRNQQAEQLTIALSSEYQGQLFRQGDLPHLEERLRRLQNETFFLADPFGLRSGEEHRHLLKYFNDTISQGGAPALSFLMRGILKTELEDFTGAEKDLHEALEIDSKLEPVVLAALGRIATLTKKEKEGREQLARATRLAPKNLQVIAIAARAELDQGKIAEAKQYVMRIHQAGVDVPEVEVTLSWLLIATSAHDSTNLKLAISLARDACLQCKYDDWLCLATLAAARASMGDYDESTTIMKRVAQIHPIQRAPLMEEWSEQIKRKESWTLFWR